MYIAINVNSCMLPGKKDPNGFILSKLGDNMELDMNVPMFRKRTDSGCYVWDTEDMSVEFVSTEWLRTMLVVGIDVKPFVKYYNNDWIFNYRKPYDLFSLAGTNKVWIGHNANVEALTSSFLFKLIDKQFEIKWNNKEVLFRGQGISKVLYSHEGIHSVKFYYMFYQLDNYFLRFKVFGKDGNILSYMTVGLNKDGCFKDVGTGGLELSY